ncbi:regulatory protein, luxR family [Neorhodopirellula lusitana]|uniref:Regulatory protein, luxR family n=1 Tax=Neorhodopirellula lusitana TaxID=445327 RepID=A0ABY1Q7Q9_9BACT|nr:LuxR C-terminal-related transcriptional regulator [Neorhodopirellula lusitana]SMP59359.1 regulatory protein, luxR family [Neorhodopirellula lusitana]
MTLASLFPTQSDAKSFLHQTATAEIPQQLEIEEVADSGESRIFRVNACRIHSAGHELRIDGLVEDVTDRHRAAVLAREALHAQAQIELLSPREKEVLGEVVAGGMNKTIARRFDISEKTVERHRSNLMKKLQLRSVAELVRLATQAENAPREES